MPDRKPRRQSSRTDDPPAHDGVEATLARAADYLANGQPVLALPLLLPALEARGSAGDQACALAAAALRATPPDASPIPPDALSATVTRLVALVQLQDEQIRTLRALIEDTL